MSWLEQVQLSVSKGILNLLEDTLNDQLAYNIFLYIFYLISE